MLKNFFTSKLAKKLSMKLLCTSLAITGLLFVSCHDLTENKPSFQSLKLPSHTIGGKIRAIIEGFSAQQNLGIPSLRSARSAMYTRTADSSCQADTSDLVSASQASQLATMLRIADIITRAHKKGSSSASICTMGSPASITVQNANFQVDRATAELNLFIDKKWTGASSDTSVDFDVTLTYDNTGKKITAIYNAAGTAMDYKYVITHADDIILKDTDASALDLAKLTLHGQGGDNNYIKSSVGVEEFFFEGEKLHAKRFVLDGVVHQVQHAVSSGTGSLSYVFGSYFTHHASGAWETLQVTSFSDTGDPVGTPVTPAKTPTGAAKTFADQLLRNHSGVLSPKNRSTLGIALKTEVLDQIRSL